MTRTIRTEVAIIGGGLIGAWTALFLRRLGRAVVLLEKGEVGAQSSGVNFGNLRVQGRHPDQLPLALRADALWEQIGELIGDTCEFERTGHLYVGIDTPQIAKLAKYAEDAARHGYNVELLDASALRNRWPWLGKRVVAGSWSVRDATANPRLVTPAAARAAQALGAEVLAGTRAVEMSRSKKGFRLTTDQDTIVESEFLINTAGAWGGHIAEVFGEHAPVFAAGPPQFVTEPLPYFIRPSVQAVDGSVIFRQVTRGNIVVAGYPRGPSDAVANRAPVHPRKTLATMRRLIEVVPRLAGGQVIRVWSGIEGYLPDMLPVIGPSRTTPGLFHAFGFCGHGFQLGPGVGEVLAELIVNGATSTPLAAFDIARFTHGIVADEKLGTEFDASLSGRL